VQYIAVFDTNILISALLSSRGTPFRCLALAKIGSVESVTCQEILDEFAQKLLLKFKFSQAATQTAIEEIKYFSRVVAISSTLTVVEDDPDDDMVIECAVVAKATHIVTGDKHLLRLGTYQNIPIVKATQFIEILNL
jgi:putative PIN family toxin of toxin-antitoxin system